MKILIRIDDVTPTDFVELSEWFKKNFPFIPVSCYLHTTDSRWNHQAWKYAKEMITKYNWEIGGHTRNHPYLTCLSNDEMYNEIFLNIKDIEDGLRDVGLEYSVSSFAYPFGDFDERVKNILKQLNLTHGLTYTDSFGYSSLLEINDPFEIGITTDGKLPLEVLNNRYSRAAKLSDIYCICLHPRWFPFLTNKTVYFDIKYLLPKSILSVGYRILNSEFSLQKIYAHLNYINSFDNINFINFKQL